LALWLYQGQNLFPVFHTVLVLMDIAPITYMEVEFYSPFALQQISQWAGHTSKTNKKRCFC
jgi:hypothetical protein